MNKLILLFVYTLTMIMINTTIHAEPSPECLGVPWIGPEPYPAVNGTLIEWCSSAIGDLSSCSLSIQPEGPGNALVLRTHDVSENSQFIVDDIDLPTDTYRLTLFCTDTLERKGDTLNTTVLLVEPVVPVSRPTLVRN